MRLVLAATGAVAALVAVAIPARAHVAAPGPECGGTLWRLMTLSDAGKKSVKWTVTPTSVPDIAKLPPPARITTARSTTFQQNNWQVTTVIEAARIASNGELVLQLFDVPTSTYINAYMPSPDCLPAGARGRGQLLAARSLFMKDCPAVTTRWQPIGATAQLSGVGFWNPVKTTAGALKNGAELRPVTGLKITQGCGHF